MTPSHRPLPIALLICGLWLLGVSVVAADSAAETHGAESVVARAIEALGGGESWRQVTSMEIRGNYSTFSTTYPFRILRQRPHAYRFEHFEADMQVVVGFDGRRAWWHNQLPLFAGVDWPTAPSIPYALGFEADAEFAGWPFLDAAARGHRLEYVGSTSYEGIDSHAVRIHLANGTQETWYFHHDTFLPAVRLARAGYVGREVDSRTFFDDYREVGAVRYPFLLEFERGNLFAEMSVEEVQLNVPVDAEAFRFPRPPLMVDLASLEGTWDVVVQSRPLPNLPWFESRSESVISADFDGRVLRERLSFLFAGRPRTTTKTFTFDRFTKRFSLVQIDDLTAHPNLFVGDTEPREGVFTLSNADSGTAWGVAGMTFTERQSLQIHDTDHFTVRWEQSPDGQHWAEVARFEYRRQGTLPADSADE